MLGICGIKEARVGGVDFDKGNRAEYEVIQGSRKVSFRGASRFIMFRDEKLLEALSREDVVFYN